jgi:O-antigen/teichoic acid export membrane protein
MSENKPEVFSPLARETAYYAVAVALPSLLSLVGMGWAVRLVEPRDFGNFNLVNITGSIASTASFYWIGQWVLRYASQFMEAPTSERYWAVLWRLSFLSVGVLSFLGLVVAVVHPALTYIVLGTGLLTAVLIVQALFLYLLQGVGLSKHYSGLQVASSLLRWVASIGLCYLWRSKPTMWPLVLGQVIGLLCGTSLGAFRLRGNMRFKLHAMGCKGLASEAVAYGGPFVAWGISMQFLNVADRYVIELLRGSFAVGLYSGIYTVATAAVTFFTTPLLLSAVPRMFRASGTNVESLNSTNEVRFLMEKTLEVLVLVSAPLLLGCTLLRQEIILLVLGTQYLQAADIFPFIVLGTLFWQLAQIYQKGFEVKANTKPLQNYIIIAAILNIVLNFLAVPKGGLIGAALATTLSFGAYLLQVYLGAKKLGVPKLRGRTLVNVVIASGFSLLVFAAVSGCLSGHWSRFISLVFSGVAYLTYLVFRKEPLVVLNIRRLLEMSGLATALN